jgi:TP901-1 family phage major tail protein
MKMSGVDVLVYLDVAGTPTLLGGQSGASLSREINVIEVTSKDGNGWAENITGVKSWSIECEGYVVVNDAAYNSLETAFLNGDFVDVEVQMPNGDKYTGQAVVSELPLEFAQDDAVTFSTTFVGNGALTKTTTPVAP